MIYMTQIHTKSRIERYIYCLYWSYYSSVSTSIIVVYLYSIIYKHDQLINIINIYIPVLPIGFFFVVIQIYGVVSH